MNERLGKMDEKIDETTKLLGQSMYHQQRTDFTSEYVARQQGYTGFINEDIDRAPIPPSRLFGNHFIKIHDTRLGTTTYTHKGKSYNWTQGATYIPELPAGKRLGVLDRGIYDIHDYGEYGQNPHKSAHYLQSLTEDDTDKEDFVWLKGRLKLGEEEIERRPWKEGEAKVIKYKHGTRQLYDPSRENKAQLERDG